MDKSQINRHFICSRVVIVILKGANKRPGVLFRRGTSDAATANGDITLTVSLIRSALIDQVSAHRVTYSQSEKAL